jgi:hypothetical protein
MSEHDQQITESEMTARRTILADGRYLIYFEFDDEEQSHTDERAVEQENV